MYSFKAKKTLLLVGGEGGHFSQLIRLSDFIDVSNEFEKVLITDSMMRSRKAPDHNILFELGALREKNGFSFMKMVSHIKKVIVFFLFLRKRKSLILLSTGPGVALFPALLVRLLRGKVIHIETWSRFQSKSSTGRLMYYIANIFFVQNKKLLNLYPKAIYCGRL